MTVDEARSLVFLPLTSPSYDIYGGDRKGANSYGDSVVALDCKTGKMRWYYQILHHDLWDYDLPAAPVLAEVKREGKTIPAVAQVTKQGFVFVLDRETGKPLYPVEERPVPKSTLPGEESSPTQPYPRSNATDCPAVDDRSGVDQRYSRVSRRVSRQHPGRKT